MTYTENYQLKKPSGDDFIDVEDLNENSEKLDAILVGKADIQLGGEEPPAGPGFVLWFADYKPSEPVTEEVPPIELTADAVGREVGVEIDGTEYGAVNVQLGSAPDKTHDYSIKILEE